MRTSGLIALAVLAGSLLGCEGKAPPASGAAEPPAPSVDWASVEAPSDPAAQVGALCHLARFADVWHGGRSPTITLHFDHKGVVTDGAAHSARFTREQWKGAMELAGNTSGGAATRALPAKAEKYADGLGKARRHAYTAVRQGDDIVLTLVKPLDDESEG